MRKAATVGLTLSLSAGLTGCAQTGEDGTPAESIMDVQVREMQRCGLTSADLYMIDFGRGSSPVVYEMIDIPCEQVPSWLEQYRETHDPDPRFVFDNVPEPTPPPTWADLRYLVLDTRVSSIYDPDKLGYDGIVFIDFDAGLIRSEPHLILGLDFDKMDTAPMAEHDVGPLLDLLAQTTPTWQYPSTTTGGPILVDIPIGTWSVSVVTRDKSLYRFEQRTGYNMAPDGFLDVYNAFWKLTE